MNSVAKFLRSGSSPSNSAAGSLGRPESKILAERISECLNVFCNVRIVEGEVLGDEALRLKFDNLRLHFLMWAKASLSKKLKPKISSSLGLTTLRLQTLMKDEDRLEEEHGLFKIYDTNTTQNYTTSRLGLACRTTYFALVGGEEGLPRKNTHKAWRISNGVQYLTFVQLLKELIDDLDAATGSEWTIHEEKAYIADVVATMSSVDLELVKESGMDDNDLIANAALAQLKRLSRKDSSQRVQDCQPVDAESLELGRPIRALDDNMFSTFGGSEPISKVNMDIQERFTRLKELSKETCAADSLPSVPVHLLAQRRILSEIRRFNDAPPFISLSLIGSSLNHVLGIFVGPPDTPYEIGIFFVRFQIPEQYPLVPPKCRLVTKIYHPNIDRNGEVCLNVLDKEWQPVWSLSDLLLAIIALLEEPNEDDFSNSEVAHMKKNDRRQFDTNARDWTKKYATGEWPQLHELEWGS